MNIGDRVLVGNGRKSNYDNEFLVHRVKYWFSPNLTETFCGYWPDRQVSENTWRQPCKVCQQAWRKAQEIPAVVVERRKRPDLVMGE